MFNTHTTEQNREQFRKCSNDFRNKFEKKFQQGFGRGNHPFKEMFLQKMSHHKPVNIVENADNFTLLLFAPGLEKQFFKATVKDQVLKVSYETPEVKDEAKYVHQEFFASSFERAFQLSNKVLSENISANYENGILKVTLPKNPETNQPAQDISVN